MADTPEAEARAALEAAGTLPDAELDLAAVALQLARIDAPEADWREAAAQLTGLAQAAVAAATADPEADAGDAERRRAALAEVIHGRFGFAGDSRNYEDMANANLIRVVERKLGLPVALGILWLHAAEAAGWTAHGIDFPGHFLLAVEGRNGQAIVDVFDGGTGLSAPDLRLLIKRIEGERAELRPGLLRPMGKRQVLLRLQNNIKLRRLRSGDMAGALACAEDMLRLAPEAVVLWREAGLMNQRLDRISAALSCLERSLELEPEGEAARRIRQVMEELRQRLN
ncbi:transglutaminase-like domain-containing protein [Siccirubricoccus sp. KC 17139]|uniref:Transglutaminase-like domain-containing protein n=1 Tax=Siccirubricoccus soli TaxID=2899147 RepID=A0ABT1D3X0_9PROT|nr:transglutaminase-like domain-containing protein [Siccirubricoccus soli]MCO6416632.1 transglutaminase-like domain-containing protein [Siccirubricoccus soli]MCP2682767.1 transglutaminase-like domain-containing protein [Siccirubricoccus soli]